MADRAEGDLPSILDQAAADGSMAQARHRMVESVPVVTDGVEPVTLEHEDSGRAPGLVAGVRRRLTPRPVPGNRRRKPAATDEDPTPAEEMDDVGTHEDKAAKTADAGQTATPAAGTEAAAGTQPAAGAATATKAKPQTAAEIVAAQKAREDAAKTGPGPEGTAVTTAVTRQPSDASGNKAAGGADGGKPAGTNPLAAAKAARETPAKGSTGGGSAKGKAALSTVGSGVKRLRNLLASLIWLAAVLAAGVLALGALFTALDQANQSNEIVRWVLDRGDDLVGPFKDLFRLETAKNTLLVNWGIAALVYLIAGKIIERFVRP